MSGEYISQEAIKNALADKFKARIGSSHIPTWNDAFDAVTNLPPAADVVEVRHGRWIQKGQKIYCSKCNRGVYIGTDDEGVMQDEMRLRHFCSACGAKMDGGQDETPTGPYDLLYEEGGESTT